ERWSAHPRATPHYGPGDRTSLTCARPGPVTPGRGRACGRLETDLVRLVTDDRGELLGVEARAADERAVDVGLRHDRGDVAGLHRAPVEHAHAVGDARVVEPAELLADRPADLLRVVGRGDLTGADRPDGLVGDDAARSSLGVDPGERALDLRERVGDLLPRLAHVQALADADDRRHVRAERRLRLRAHQRVVLAVVLTTLRVPDDDVADAELGEHRRRDLARVGAAGVRRHVLRAVADLELVGVDERLHRPQ